MNKLLLFDRKKNKVMNIYSLKVYMPLKMKILKEKNVFIFPLSYKSY